MGVYFYRQTCKFFYLPDHVFYRLGQRTTHRIDNTDRIGRRFFHDAGEQIGKIFIARSGRIIGEIDRIHTFFASVVDTVNALAEHILPGPAELVFQFRIANWYLDDHSVGPTVYRLIDIYGKGTGKGEDFGLQAQFADGFNRLEIFLGYSRHPRLDSFNTDIIELLGNPHFVIFSEHDSRGLLPVPQGRIMDFHFFRQFKFRGHSINKVIRAHPPLIFLQIFIFHP